MATKKAIAIIIFSLGLGLGMLIGTGIGLLFGAPSPKKSEPKTQETKEKKEN